ncbi:MAG: tetratricopeptide repeat protein [Kineosporiaceae bacterium]
MDDVERYRTAQRLLTSGDPHSALQVLQPLLSTLPGDTSVLLLAARAYFDTAQLEKAEQVFRTLVEADPADHYAHAALGRTLFRRRRLTEASAHLRIATALDPQPWYGDCLRDAEEAIAKQAASTLGEPAGHEE